MMSSTRIEYVLAVIIVVVVCVTFTPFIFDYYNQSDLKKLPDPNATNAQVYGVKGGPAKQLANKYPDSPENAKRAEAIRNKFFGGQQAAPIVADMSKKTDSTQAKKADTKDSTAKAK